MAHYTKSSGRLNANGLYAQGQAVGLLELMGSGCILKDDHEAVQLMTIQHEDPNVFACSVDDDCEYFPDAFCYFAGLNRGGCVNGQCVGRHATEVASRIGSVYDSEPHHAAGVDLFVANGWTNTHPFELAMRYDWFLSQNVSLINESITFTDQFDVVSSSGVFGPTAQDV